MPVIVSNMQLITAQRQPRFGMSEIDGHVLTGADHLIQSIKNIFTTKKTQRLMLREYGMTPYLDDTVTPKRIATIYAEIADLLGKYEPRFKLKKVSLNKDPKNGVFIINFDGLNLISDKPLIFEVAA